MMNRKSTALAEPIVQLKGQLDQIRSTQPLRSRLPESLWSAAVELARQHGVYPVAHALRLDYMGLKKRLGRTPSRQGKASKAAFFELTTLPSTVPRECVIEFESTSGAKMRIQWKGAAPPDWASLLRAWRENTG